MIQSDLLTLTRWLSPAFPLGGFAYSHGFEELHARGDLTNAQDLQSALHALISHGGLWVDAVVRKEALGGEDMRASALALAASKERAEEALAQGRAFVQTVKASDGVEIAEGPLVAVLGEAARGFDLPHATIIALYIQAFVANITSIAVRMIPLGQSEGQHVLRGLEPLIYSTAERAAEARLSEVGSASFGLDCMSMDHAFSEVRLFKT